MTSFLFPPDATHRAGEVPLNCAWVLAINQYRIIIIDLDSRGDVEASLAHYRATDLPAGRRGIPPWVTEWLPQGLGRSRDSHLTAHLLPDGRARIDVLHLGGQSGSALARTLSTSLRSGLNASGYEHAFLLLPSRDGAVAEALGGIGDRTVLICEAAATQVEWADTCRGVLARGTARPGLALLDRPTLVGPERDTSLGAARALFGVDGEAGDGGDDLDPLGGAPFIVVPTAPADLGGLRLLVPFEKPRAVVRSVDPAQPPASVQVRPITQAYLTLGRALCRHPLTAPPVLSDGARRRYQQAAVRGQVSSSSVSSNSVSPSSVSPGPFTIVHRAQHSRIAAWIEHGLAAEGCPVRRAYHSDDLEIPSGATVVTLPDVDLPPLPGADRISVRVSGAPADFDLTRLENELDAASADEVIDLAKIDGADAWGFLRRRLGFGDGRSPAVGMPPLREPIPAGGPLPLRNPAFTGRQPVLEAVQRALNAGGGPGQVWVVGPPGVGKSELAREYTHRFGADYSWVCWLPAESAASVHAGLHALAHDRRLGVLGAVLSSLRDRLEKWDFPWLVVLDGVVNPEDLGDLLPRTGHGHILITARDAPAGVRSLELPPFDPPEAVALLGTLSQLRDEPELTNLAAAVGVHPLSVHLAGSWLTETARQMLRTGRATSSAATQWAAAELTFRLVNGDEGPGGGVPGSPDQHYLVQLALDLLANMQTTATVVRHLAMALTALNPSGVNVGLLSETGMIEHLAAAAGVDGDGLLADSTELHLALYAGVRIGLFDLSWPTGVRLRGPDITRETLGSRTGQPALVAVRRHVLNGLAATCPTDAGSDKATQVLRYTELGGHLFPSGALASREPEVRRWIVRQIRHWYGKGDVATHRWAVRLATTVFQDWKVRFGSEDPLRLRLGTQLANLYRALGDDARALEIDEEVLVGQRRTQGTNHPRTWMAVRGKASDLLGLGRFAEAMFEQQHAWEGLCNSYGEDHLETLTAAQELSLCLMLNGQDREAAEREMHTLRRLARMTGRRNAALIRSVVQLSLVMRNLGQLATARGQLTRVREWTQDNGFVEDRSQLRLRRAELVIARDEGQAAMRLMEHPDLLRAYEDLLGAQHPEVAACRLSVAGHVHRSGDADEAIRLARSCLTSFTELRGPEHPFVSVCHDQLSVFYRAAADAHQEARDHAQQARTGLMDALGDDHPWTLAALVNEANLVFDEGQVPLAKETDQGVLMACRPSLVRRHPLVVAAEHNLRLSSRGRGTGVSGAIRADVLIELP